MSNSTNDTALRNAIAAHLLWREAPGEMISPFLRLDPLMTDDDVDFHGGILYMRGLLDATAQALITVPRWQHDARTGYDTERGAA